MNKDNATAIGKIKLNKNEWYVPQYTPSVSQQAILSKQILDKVHTELRYVERPVLTKETKAQKLWNFDLGTQESINVPIWIIIGFQQTERQNSQNSNNDTLYRPPVTDAQCIIGTEKYHDSVFLYKYDDDGVDYSRGYGQIEDVFKTLTKDDIL